MARAVAYAFCCLVLCLGGSASALVCEDPHTGTVRESGTDSCLLGERQILPQEAGEIPTAPGGTAPAPEPPAPQIAPRPVVSSAPPPAPLPPPVQTRCLGPTSAVATAEQTIRAHLGAVTFASGRVIIDAAGSDGTYTASLGRLDPQVEVHADARPVRLTLNCAAGNCWQVRRSGGIETSPSASFPLDDGGQADPVGKALTRLIRQCGGS